MVNIVFICTGNLCRSPIAEGIMRTEWIKRKKDGLFVSSMGIHSQVNSEASQYAQEICMENNIDISSHRSRRLVFSELESADLILSMEMVHKEYIRIFFPKFNDKIFLLGAWPGNETKKDNIKDPMGGSIKTYREVYKIIKGHIERIIPFIEEMFF